MDRTMQMEQFSRAFVAAIAAQAGCNHSVPVVDDHSIDLILSKQLDGALCSDPKIGIQLKATCEKVCFSDSLLKYELHNLKNYNDLRKTNLQTPRLLVVLYMPDNPADWIQYKSECIHLFRNAFWVSLRGMPEIHNKTSITLNIPVSQRFDVNALNEMMQKIAAGGVL